MSSEQNAWRTLLDRTDRSKAFDQNVGRYLADLACSNAQIFQSLLRSRIGMYGTGWYGYSYVSAPSLVLPPGVTSKDAEKISVLNLGYFGTHSLRQIYEEHPLLVISFFNKVGRSDCRATRTIPLATLNDLKEIVEKAKVKAAAVLAPKGASPPNTKAVHND